MVLRRPSELAALTVQVPDGSNFASLLQKVFNSLFSGCFVHDSVVHVGYSAFAVNQRREGHPVESVLLAQSLVANHDRVGSPFSL